MGERFRTDARANGVVLLEGVKHQILECGPIIGPISTSKQMNDTSSAVQKYFRAKRKELMALAELPVCKHPSLIGGHREQIYRTYLADLLPKRFSVERGMVYGISHRSKETDIVIWDSNAYPSLPLLDHSFFFAESVKAVIECKSSWSSANFQDVLEKCMAVDTIVPTKEPDLEDLVLGLQDQVAALEVGEVYEGSLLSKHQIGTVAMFLTGGKSLTPAKLVKLCQIPIDYAWPDLTIFVETGFVITKDMSGSEGGGGRLYFYKFQDDGLLAFSTELLKLLQTRVSHAGAPFFLDQYGIEILDWSPIATHGFRMHRLAPGRQSFFS